jgi:hypothetical protein
MVATMSRRSCAVPMLRASDSSVSIAVLPGPAARTARHRSSSCSGGGRSAPLPSSICLQSFGASSLTALRRTASASGRRSVGTSSSSPAVSASRNTTCSAAGIVASCGCFSASRTRRPRSSVRGCPRPGGSRSGRRTRAPRTARRTAGGRRRRPVGRQLGLAADARHRPADVDRGQDALAEQVCGQRDLPVGDRDEVGRDVRREVLALRLDDRQRGQRSATELRAQAGGALQQARVDVEDVAREGLPPRWSTQQQRQLPVGLRVPGEVVVDDEDVASLLHEVLADGGRRVGRDELQPGEPWPEATTTVV